MTLWKVVGKYLDRDIKTLEVSVKAPIRFESIDTSVLLLLLRVAMPPESLRNLMHALVDQQPLAISVHGIKARAAFELLIAELSDGSTRKHVMTKILEHGGVAEAVEDLLHSTWPSGDRFDDWTDYAVLIVGDDSREVERIVGIRCESG